MTRIWVSVACEVSLTYFLYWQEHQFPFLKGQRWGLLPSLGGLQRPGGGLMVDGVGDGRGRCGGGPT